MNIDEIIDKAISELRFYQLVHSDIKRLIGLVQDNQDYFGNPPAGQSTVATAVNKLEKLIAEYRKSNT